MEYHGLLQAFSRTNRVLNEKKRFGKIVCFRDLKSNVDAAIKLFSNSNNPEEIVRPPFEEIKQEYKELASDFLKKYPDTNCIDLLQSETAKKEFVLAFRDIIRKHAEIQIYEDYSEEADDLGMTEQQFMDFRSKYLDIHDTLHSLIQHRHPNRMMIQMFRMTETSVMWISALNSYIATLSMWHISLNSLQNLTHIVPITQNAVRISLIR